LKKTGCLLIHGFTGSPWVFNELKAKLAQRNIEISAPLLPGHGTNSDDLARIKWTEWFDCAVENYLLLRQSCSRILVIGVSVGGAIALLLCSKYKLDGVITLSAPLQFYDPRLRIIPFLRPFKRNWKKKFHGNNNQFLKEAGYDSYPLAGVQQCAKLLRVVRNNLEDVFCPALILHGSGDKRIHEKNSHLIEVGIMSLDKKVILYPNSCHTITKGPDARQVENDIIDFINRVAK